MKLQNTVQNAWLKTLEEGIHTYDIFKEGSSKQKVGTREFGQAIVNNLGQLPQHLPSVSYEASKKLPLCIRLQKGLSKGS